MDGVSETVADDVVDAYRREVEGLRRRFGRQGEDRWPEQADALPDELSPEGANAKAAGVEREDVVLLSAVSGEGVDALMRACWFLSPTRASRSDGRAGRRGEYPPNGAESGRRRSTSPWPQRNGWW